MYLISFLSRPLLHSLSCPWISLACQHASTLLTLLAASSKHHSTKGNWKNRAPEPDCPVLQNHPRWNNPPAFMCLSMHRRWCNRARIANNEVRREKNIFNLIFIAQITKSFSVPYMNIMGVSSWFYLAKPSCSKFNVLQCKREMKKKVRTNVI